MKKITFSRSFIAICLLVFAIVASSCHKEGLGGNASINGTVSHHDKAIPNCKVYIKFNTSDFPGESPADYDGSVIADGNGAYAFPKLYPGDYYLYGIGYDNAIMQIVKGGIPVKVKRNKSVSIDVPVTED
jgi:hypothetical protein